MLIGCGLVFLLAACGSEALTGAGTPMPMATRTVTLKPTATKAVTLTPPVTKLALTFECKGGFSPDATREKVCVHTLPGALLTITVTYCTGSVDQSATLRGTFVADKAGRYEWNWVPRATCQGNPSGATGFWKGTTEVTVTLDGQHLIGSIAFMV